MKFKYIFSALLLLTLTANAQFALRYPSNVIFVAGNFQDKFPYASTLRSAVTIMLSQTSNPVSSVNPYVFWISSDTLKIADWNTYYNTLKTYYIETGKVKLAGFTNASGGVGQIIGIGVPDDITSNYGWATWDPADTTLVEWVKYLGQIILDIDTTLYGQRRPKFTGGVVLVNDTVTVDDSYIEAIVDRATEDSPLRIDTTHILYDTKLDTVEVAMKFADVVEIIDSGYIRLGLYQKPAELFISRAIYQNNGDLYWSGNGAEDEIGKVAIVDTYAGYLDCDTCITVAQLASDVASRFIYSGTATFTGTDTILTVVTGDSTDIITVTPIYSASIITIDPQDTPLIVIPTSNGFYIKRQANGSSGLKVAWMRKKL